VLLQRTKKLKRIILSRIDRFLWVWLSRVWSGWRTALVIVKPETIIGWHRQRAQPQVGLRCFISTTAAMISWPVLLVPGFFRALAENNKPYFRFFSA
jgi:hypothetical protein